MSAKISANAGGGGGGGAGIGANNSSNNNSGNASGTGKEAANNASGGTTGVGANTDVHPRKRKIRSKANNAANNANNENNERERLREREREREIDRDHHHQQAHHHHFHHHHNAKSGGGASSAGSGAPTATTHTLTTTATGGNSVGGGTTASGGNIGAASGVQQNAAAGIVASGEERSAAANASGTSAGAGATTAAGASSTSNYAAGKTTDGNAAAHDYPFTNCIQMSLKLRKQLEKKWRNLYPIKPRPPQGYAEYLLNKRTYLLNDEKVVQQQRQQQRQAQATDVPFEVANEIVRPPVTISKKMSDIFVQQERERRALYKRHTVEREKLCLNVEQEIIRVHSKAARNVSCQSLPYSVCTLLKDEEVYNFLDQTAEEKERGNRHRFNGRQLLSWLQDVDDKWEKIKESMVLRHHNEAESLHAVQLMDWEIALKNYELCDFKTTVVVDKEHVPIIHVNDGFDLLPA